MAVTEDSKRSATPVLTDPVEQGDVVVPLLTDAEAPPRAAVTEDQVASVQADLTALTRELAERLLDGALRDMEAALFEQVADRLREELPELIDRVLRERLLGDD